MRNAAITPPPHICSDMHHCFPKEPPQSMFLTNSLSRQITYTSPGLMFCVRNEFTNFFLHEKINSAFMSQMKLLAEQFSNGHFH